MSGPMDKHEAGIVCDLFYLAFTVWREARGETRAGQVAVAWSVLNRVTRPGWWGNDISSVVTKRWQYSSLTDPKDPQLSKAWPLLTDPSWLACLGAAHDVLSGNEPNPVPGADSYFDDSIAPPFWTKTARYVATIGALAFYDVDHDYEKATTGHV